MMKNAENPKTESFQPTPRHPEIGLTVHEHAQGEYCQQKVLPALANLAQVCVVIRGGRRLDVASGIDSPPILAILGRYQSAGTLHSVRDHCVMWMRSRGACPTVRTFLAAA
jgi:hypothetical protein